MVEYRQLIAHGETAADMGIEAKNIFICQMVGH